MKCTWWGWGVECVSVGVWHGWCCRPGGQRSQASYTRQLCADIIIACQHQHQHQHQPLVTGPCGRLLLLHHKPQVVSKQPSIEIVGTMPVNLKISAFHGRWLKFKHLKDWCNECGIISIIQTIPFVYSVQSERQTYTAVNSLFILSEPCTPLILDGEQGFLRTNRSIMSLIHFTLCSPA